MLSNVLNTLFQDKPTYKDVFLRVGIKFENNKLSVLDENGVWQEDIITKDRSKMKASKLIRESTELQSFFIEFAEKDNYYQDVINSQVKVLMNNAAKVPSYVYKDANKTAYAESWSNSSVSVLAHLSHWTPAYGWNIINYSTSKGILEDVLYDYIYKAITANNSVVLNSTIETEIYKWKSSLRLLNVLSHFGTPKGVGLDKLKEKWTELELEFENNYTFKIDINSKERAVPKDLKKYISNSQCIILPETVNNNNVWIPSGKFRIITNNFETVKYEKFEE